MSYGTSVRFKRTQPGYYEAKSPFDIGYWHVIRDDTTGFWHIHGIGDAYARMSYQTRRLAMDAVNDYVTKKVLWDKCIGAMT